MANPSDIRALLDEVNAAGRALLQSSDGGAGAGLIHEGPASRALITAAHNVIVRLQKPGVYMEELTWQARRHIGCGSFRPRQLLTPYH